MKVFTLKKRKDFLKAAKGFKVVTNGLVLQAAFALPIPKDDCCFVGYTATKKLGKANVRNKTKRRLRVAASMLMPKLGVCGASYVFIGRHNTTSLDFGYFMRKAEKAVVEINKALSEVSINNDKKNDNHTD